jgi:hypothetical protein
MLGYGAMLPGHKCVLREVEALRQLAPHPSLLRLEEYYVSARPAATGALALSGAPAYRGCHHRCRRRDELMTSERGCKGGWRHLACGCMRGAADTNGAARCAHATRYQERSNTF